MGFIPKTFKLQWLLGYSMGKTVRNSSDGAKQGGQICDIIFSTIFHKIFLFYLWDFFNLGEASEKTKSSQKTVL